MPVKLLIFDLDGTLIDSAPDLRTACNKLLKDHNAREITIEETMHFVGNGAQKLVERAFKATGTPLESIDEATQAFLKHYKGHESDETRPYDGVRETLNNLKEQGYRLALCTNKPQQPTDNLLQHLNLAPYFDVALGGDKLAHKKPAPDMLLWILDQLNFRVEDALMIGDSPNDIGAAQSAGMKSIAVSYGYRKIPVEEMGADQIIHHMNDLPCALKELSLPRHSCESGNPVNPDPCLRRDDGGIQG